MKNFFFYICIFLIPSVAFAQKDSLSVRYDTSSYIKKKEFNNDNLNDYRTDKEFNYEVKKREPTLLEKIWDWLKRILLKILSWIFGVEKATGILSAILRVLPYIIAGLVLFFIIKFFLKVNMRNMIDGHSNNTSTVTLTEEEELIKNEDINSLINKAIEDKNYRLAIRYYYLLILQKLSNSNVINWEQQKTNEDYIKEIQQEAIKNKFISSTYLYDFVWYGNFEVDETAFLKAQHKFNELSKLIK